MSTVVQLHTKEEEDEEEKKKTKAVSWAKQWDWKEGEEEKTQSNRLAWKKKRAELKSTEMKRTAAEQREYEENRTKWCFNILKTPRLAKYIILACAQSSAALTFLQNIFKYTNISLDKEIPVALAEFRERVTWEMVTESEVITQGLYSLWRVKEIELNFVLPENRSSTDTDQEKRLREAAISMQDEAVVENYKMLPYEIQVMVANWTNRRDPENPEAAALQFREFWGDTAESEATTIHPASSAEHDNEGKNRDREIASNAPPKAKKTCPARARRSE